MMPSIEIIASQLDSEMMAGHSDNWADGKENKDFWDMDEGDDPWGETPDANKYDLWKD